MNDLILRTSAIAIALSCALLAACGEDDHSEEEEGMCTHYGECYEHERAEGKLPPAAFMECDERCPLDGGSRHTDLASCTAYYSQFSQISAAEVEGHCMEAYPSM